MGFGIRDEMGSTRLDSSMVFRDLAPEGGCTLFTNKKRDVSCGVAVQRNGICYDYNYLL